MYTLKVSMCMLNRVYTYEWVRDKKSKKTFPTSNILRGVKKEEKVTPQKKEETVAG